jgi:glycosyltransferase involved in cell wall biosynthesis
MSNGQPIPLVSVIIPTMATLQRKALLMRAIESIRASSGKPLCIIVVVNGDRYDVGVCDWLKSQRDVRYEYVASPSAPGAVLRGRELVQTEFFSTLDDDDEYLAGMTDRKVSILTADHQMDLLVANAYQCSGDVDTLLYDQLGDVSSRPLECLMQFNWLHNGNALFRSVSVTTAYFKDYHAYGEWTWLAFRLAMDGKKVAVLDIPSFRYNDTSESLSKSSAYAQSYMSLFRRMLDRMPPRHIKRMIHRNMGAACHDASVASLRDGRKLDAWRYHWQSLVEIEGLKYLGYTRHLVLA